MSASVIDLASRRRLGPERGRADATAWIRLIQRVAALDEADAENMLFHVDAILREWARQEADGGEGEPPP